nr:hypothetical protein [Tanacetum cinerariifolium]
LPSDIYSLVNHHRVAKDLWERVQLLMQGFDVPVFSLKDDPITCLNKAMAFLTAVASSRFPSTNNQLKTSLNSRNQATIQDGRVTVQQVQERQGKSYSGTGYKSNATSSGGKNASGLDFMNSSDSIARIVLRCSSPILRESTALGIKNTQASGGVGKGEAIKNLSPLGS